MKLNALRTGIQQSSTSKSEKKKSLIPLQETLQEIKSRNRPKYFGLKPEADLSLKSKIEKDCINAQRKIISAHNQYQVCPTLSICLHKSHTPPLSS